MVSGLDSGSGGPCSSPLHPGVQMDTSKCAGGNPAMD